MEHIRQYDWCAFQADRYFVESEGLDKSVTEYILRNKFRDPLVSSESEEEGGNKIDWNEVFKQKDYGSHKEHIYIPGLCPLAPYPKLSALTVQQHFQCLKVLCAQCPDILKREFMPRPMKQDHKVFEEVKELYLKEQKEYMDWAKALWTSTQCVRALRPKPNVEIIYEAEFKMRAEGLGSFPKHYEMAAQIPLETRNVDCKIVFQKDLINVTIEDLPQIEYPEMTKRYSIFKPCSMPEVCVRHPCRFILPHEKEMSILPMTEIHRELAQYAADNQSQYIASENALKCLVESDQHWTLPVSVCQVIGVDGESFNVVVIGSEFSINRESARRRTYKAFRHLLLYSFIPPVERAKLLDKSAMESIDHNSSIENMNYTLNDEDLSSDDDDSQLLIDMDTSEDTPIETENTTQTSKESLRKDSNNALNELKTIEINDSIEIKDQNETVTRSDKDDETNVKKNDFYSCTCKESMFEKPPLRSYIKWQIQNVTKNDNYNIIVHCAHKARNNQSEVVLEPIPEYQLELGASKLSDSKTKSLALQLLLRRNASLINVRIEPSAGDVVTIEEHTLNELTETNENMTEDICNILYSTLDQLQGLLPGNYVLKHEPSHGNNAMLYATKIKGSDQKFDLEFDCSQLAEADEAKSLKIPPVLTTTLLPFHKFRKILPCAFTPFDKHIAKETRKPATRLKTPPQAIKWPKRKLRKPNRNIR